MCRLRSIRCDFCDILIYPKEMAFKNHSQRMPTNSRRYPTRAMLCCRACLHWFDLPLSKWVPNIDPDTPLSDLEFCDDLEEVNV